MYVAHDDAVAEEIRARRAEFWMWAARIATGVVIGQFVVVLVLYAIAKVWLDANF